MDTSAGESFRHRRGTASVDNSSATTEEPPNTAPSANAEAECPKNPAAAAAARAAHARLTQLSSASHPDVALAATSGTEATAGPSSRRPTARGEDMLKRRRALEAAEHAVKAFNLHVVQVRIQLSECRLHSSPLQKWLGYSHGISQYEIVQTACTRYPTVQWIVYSVRFTMLIPHAQISHKHTEPRAASSTIAPHSHSTESIVCITFHSI
jgi:hypothetical protein